MASTFVTEIVTLEGFQSITQLGKYGNYQLVALLPDEVIKDFVPEYLDCLKWAKSKLKNPKRCVTRPEFWEELEGALDGLHSVKFRWNEGQEPPIVDTVGKLIPSDTLIYSGSKVKLAFTLKPYILNDGVTIGVKPVLKGVMVVELKSGAGVDRGNATPEEVVAMFGNTAGFVADEPNVVPSPEAEEDELEDDF